MVPDSPVQALGNYADGTRGVLVDLVRYRHERAAEGHEASGSRYAMGFGSQWRDLLDDARDAFSMQGFQTHKLSPAGYSLPVVNNCLIYVWRGKADAAGDFASSPTRRNGFDAPLPDPMLIEPSFADRGEPAEEAPEERELKHLIKTLPDTMSLVLVIVDSSPRQLRSIQWAIAVLDENAKTQLHGQESIWESEIVADDAVEAVESFDSGTPDTPVVELQQQDRPRTDA